ncbi:MAG: flippase, partial [Cyanobacteria bacterium P01_D01_bin.56]
TLSLTFVFYMILGRVLGPEEYGVFTAATALGGIFAFFIQFGLQDLLAREIAATPQKGVQSTSIFLLIEGVNCFCVLLILLPIAKLLNFQGIGLLVCYLVVIAGACRCAKQTLRAVFRGLGHFRSETISVSIERSVMFLLASIVLLVSGNLAWVVATMALVRLIDVICLFYYLNSRISITSPINFKRFKHAVKMAYPFALSGVLWVLYYQIDALMLKVMAPAVETGFYGAAYSLLEIFSALPRVIFYVALPKFSRCYTEEPEQLSQQIQKTTYFLLIAVLPVITLAGFAQTLLIQLTYGQSFLTSVNSLAILLPSLAIKMFGSLVLIILQAIRKERFLPSIMLAAVITNIITNALLIPSLGAIGAALATLLSEIILAVTGLILIGQFGYRPVIKKLLMVSILSLLITSIPSLLFKGLSMAAATILMAVSVISILLVLWPRQLIKRSG